MFQKTKDEKSNQQAGATSVGEKIKINGDLKGLGDINIDGVVEGSLQTNENVYIGQNAQVNADIKAKNAEIAGKINGNIELENSLILKKTASLTGNITVKDLSIESGAYFNGSCQMQEKPKETASNESKTQTENKTEENKPA